MPTISILGDAATTTALAIASSWVDDDVVLIELDPSGGSLAAWLDMPITPSLSSIVAAVHRGDVGDRIDARRTAPTDTWSVVDSMVRRAPGGLRFVPTPFTRREAARAVDEARSLLLPTTASQTDVTTIFDLGQVRADELPDQIVTCDLCLVVHHQERSSPRAAAVRLERFAELIESIEHRRGAARDHGVVIGVVGDRPFEPREIVTHVRSDPAAEFVTLADDPVAAAVLAGRSGVSARRLRRQPLIRDARRAATLLAARISTSVAAGQPASLPGVDDPKEGVIR